jgi:hypothetical protein
MPDPDLQKHLPQIRSAYSFDLLHLKTLFFYFPLFMFSYYLLVVVVQYGTTFTRAWLAQEMELADLDPAFHINADPYPAPHQSDANLQPLVYGSSRVFLNLRSPGIDSNKSITPVYIAWRAGTTTLSEFSPHILFKNSSTGLYFDPLLFASAAPFWSSEVP